MPRPSHNTENGTSPSTPGCGGEGFAGSSWYAGTFTGPAGLFRQRTEISKPQRDLLTTLDIPVPKQIIELAARR